MTEPPAGTVATITGRLNHNPKRAKGRELGPFRFLLDPSAIPILKEHGWIPRVTRFRYQTCSYGPFFELVKSTGWIKGDTIHLFHDNSGKPSLLLTSENWAKRQRDNRAKKTAVGRNHEAYIQADGSILVPMTGNEYYFRDAEPYINCYRAYTPTPTRSVVGDGYDHAACIKALMEREHGPKG